jgi:hypothetical protein
VQRVALAGLTGRDETKEAPYGKRLNFNRRKPLVVVPSSRARILAALFSKIVTSEPDQLPRIVPGEPSTRKARRSRPPDLPHGQEKRVRLERHIKVAGFLSGIGVWTNRVFDQVGADSIQLGAIQVIDRAIAEIISDHKRDVVREEELKRVRK